MKNRVKKPLSLLLAVVMMLCVVPITNANIKVSAASSVQNKLDSFINSYPAGKRWTGSFDGGKQCYGFAKLVVYNLFGKNSSGGYRSWSYAGVSTSGMKTLGSITSYSYANVKSLLKNAKCGDVLQFNTTKQHSMIIYSVGSDGLTVYDCNWDNNCGIRKAYVGFGAWSGRNSSKLTLLRSDNYPAESQVSHTVNSSYGKNFTSYPKSKITAANIFDANHNQISSTAWIGTSDKCTIHEVYTDGCCKVSYPLDSGGTKTVYSKISLFNTHKHSYSENYESAHPHKKYMKCSCGDWYYTGAEAASYDSGKITTAATCKSTGVKTYTCTICKATKTEIVAKNPSNHAGGTAVKNSKAATCTTKGYTGDTYCLGCGIVTVKGKDIAVKAHTYDSGKITTAATCKSTGVKTYACTICKTTKTETIAKNPSNHAGGTAVKNSKAATCTANGYTGDTYCLGCGVTTSKGREISAKGHSYDSGKITTAATCKATGVKTYTCTVCKATKTETVAKLNHRDSNGDGKCDMCGFKVGESGKPDTPDDSSNDCNHICHKSGFEHFLYIIVRMFWRLFKINQVCDCGFKHY